MQSNRTAGRSSSFTVSVVDDAGVKVEGTSASWELFDERGVSIDAGVVADFDAAADTVTFEIEATALALPTNVPSAGREIVVTLATAGGEVELRDYFLLIDNQPLKLLGNSFMTYPEVLAIRASFGPTLDGWDAVTDRETRSSALADAYERLNRMVYKVGFIDPMVHASSYAAYGTGTDEPFGFTRRVRLRGMSIEQFDALPAGFVKALKRAQLIEANVILGGDIVGNKRQDGIISESIGESSAFFNSKPYLNLPITRQAYEELRRYVVFNIGAVRG
ncbi:MAG TPA: hypothetical protein H9899_07605 [Candidatus Sphingomonas excrementigallinarum]|nr:hypothetical protein [Candidatus Sphingomonas excrementigallinarum]